MNFERGKDPKEALKIGKIANALEIVGIAEIRIEQEPDRDPGNQLGTIVRWSKRYERSGISESHCIRILMGIEAMELNPEEYALVHWPRRGEQPADNSYGGRWRSWA